MNYYNEIDPYAAQWLRNLIQAGHIPKGDVDERSITDVQPGDLAGYTQCHFFAGIGGWAYALRLAGWPDDRPVWTGSPPCQPFSGAGKQKAQADERHLWPDMFRLIRECRPAVVFGEQVANAVRHGWLDGVCDDVESAGYTIEAAVIPACAVNAPHRRDRLWFACTLGDGIGARLEGHTRDGDDQTGRTQQGGSVAETSRSGDVADNDQRGCKSRQRDDSTTRHRYTAASKSCASSIRHTSSIRLDEQRDSKGDAPEEGRQQGHDFGGELSRGVEGSSWRNPWRDSDWLISAHDGKARRVKPGLQLLVDGVSNQVGRLRAYGNAIVPQVAAEMIKAYME